MVRSQKTAKNNPRMSGGIYRKEEEKEDMERKEIFEVRPLRNNGSSGDQFEGLFEEKTKCGACEEYGSSGSNARKRYVATVLCNMTCQCRQIFYEYSFAVHST